MPALEQQEALDLDVVAFDADSVCRLLKLQGVSFSRRQVRRALRAETTAEAVLPPGVRFAAILDTVGIDSLKLGYGALRHIDRTRLPALIDYDGAWRLLDSERNALYLYRDGKPEIVEAADLENRMIVWCIRRSQQGPEQTEDKRAHAILFQEMFRSRRWLLDIALATVVVNLLAVAVSIFAMQVYDRVVPTLAYATLTTLVAGMGVVVCLDWVLKNLRARTLDRVSLKVDINFSKRLFNHLMNLDLNTRPRSLGTLASQISGLEFLRQFFSSTIIFSLIDLPFALMFICFIWIIGGPIVWVYILLFPVAAILGWIAQKRLRSLIAEKLNRSNERQGLLVDTLAGTEVIQSSKALDTFSEAWADISRSVAKYSYRARAISNFTTVTVTSLTTVAYVSALVVGVVQIEAGHLTMGGIIACSILGGRIIGPVAQAVQHLVQFEQVSQVLKLLNHILSLPVRRSGNTHFVPEQAPQRIGLDQAAFSYASSPVRRLSVSRFDASSGERILLLGEVGSGKSTLLKILAGLYTPTDGQVLLGDVSMPALDQSWVNTHIGYVAQSPTLFKGTLRSNIDLAGDAADGDFLNAVDILGLDRIARTNPEGFDLSISEGGEGLSGGQARLVTLSRIFLQRPKIWLLDEPIASLDSGTARIVANGLDRTMHPDDILIVASHEGAELSRLVTRGVVMDGGFIKFDGPVTQALEFFASKQQANATRGRDIPTEFTSKVVRESK